MLDGQRHDELALLIALPLWVGPVNVSGDGIGDVVESFGQSEWIDEGSLANTCVGHELGHCVLSFCNVEWEYGIRTILAMTSSTPQYASLEQGVVEI